MNIPKQTQMGADFWRDVERAKQMSPQERVRIAHELFERAVYLMTQGLRMQFPEASDDEIAAFRRDKLARVHQWESRNAPVGTSGSASAEVAQ